MSSKSIKISPYLFKVQNHIQSGIYQEFFKNIQKHKYFILEKITDKK